jgi:dipeptidyl aminopeptidase/acylaminoacyl peptidase
MPSFSPDGQRVAMICNLAGTPQVWIVGVNGGWPSLAISTTDEVTSVYWSPTQEWLAFSEAPGGGLNEQTYIVRPDGSQLQRITTNDKADNWLNGWSGDGKQLLIESNMSGGIGMDVYLVDPFTRTFKLSSRNEGTGEYSEVTEDHRFALLRRLHERGDDDLYLVNLGNGQETLLTEHSGTAQPSGHMTLNGNAIYASSDIDLELGAFIRIRIGETGKPGPPEVIASRKDAELQSAVPNRQGNLVALFWNKDGRTELTFFHPETGRITPGPTLPTELADPDELSFSPDGKLLALTLSGSTSAPNIWILDLHSMQLRQISFSNHPGVDLEHLIRPTLVSYKASDGLGLSGWLYLPKSGTKPYPLVVSIHGGPETQEVASFHSDYQVLLAEGIAVFAPNIRGSAGFGKTFVNLDNGSLRVNAVRDVRDTVNYLISVRDADPKHVGIMGGSYGGYMTMAALAEYPDLFAAGVDMYGIVNFETFFKNTEPWMAAVSKMEYGDPATQASLLRDLSPIHKLDRIKAPTLVLHGDHDTNVPVNEAEQVVAGLKQHGVPVQYVLFPGEGHGWSMTSTRIQSNLLIANWFHRYLQP